MKKFVVGIVTITIVIGFVASSYASDWDKAGKALAIIEGARILTGGRMDILGGITGINQNSWFSPRRKQYNYSHVKSYKRHPRRAWVPNYVWRKKYIRKHEEYDNRYGKVIVEGHYIRYMVEDGGYWE